jgi:hypothetical protein
MFQTAPEVGDAYTAECGRFELEPRATANMGHCLRVWEIRSEDSPLLVREMDGFSLDEAKARAERLADERVPVIIEG